MKQIAAVLILVGAILPLSAQTPQDLAFSKEMMNYFQVKPENFVADSIKYISSKTEISGHFRDITTAFFSKCFQDPVFKTKMDASLSYSNSKLAKEFFSFAEKFDIDKFLVEQKPSPAVNDLYWSVYFASGETKYLSYLLNIYLTHRTEKKDLILYLAAGTAGWSLSSNSHQYKPVRNFLLSIESPANRNSINELVTDDPSVFRQREVEFYQTQHQKGVW